MNPFLTEPPSLYTQGSELSILVAGMHVSNPILVGPGENRY